MWHKLFSVAVVAGLVSCGCEKRSDAHQGTAETQYRLRQWGDYFTSSVDAGLDMENREAIREATDLLVTTRLIRTSDARRLLVDYWGHEFRWMRKRGYNNTVITITSLGRNGIYEDGVGDDQYIEIQISGNGNSLKKITVRSIPCLR
jgi:hypothetical protein